MSIMYQKSEAVKQARKELIQQTFNEIHNVLPYSNFRSNIFYVIAKLGLQLKAKEVKLFDIGDWDNPECRDELIKKLGKFLNRHIR